MVGRTTSLVGLETFKYITNRMPVLTGDALRGTIPVFKPVGNMASFQILFRMVDRERGHPYIWYIEHGRPAISGKLMRFWKTKALGKENPLGERGNVVFSTAVDRSWNYSPSAGNIIQPAMALASLRHPRIATLEVRRWLGR
jgi:hypothetical protein